MENVANQMAFILDLLKEQFLESLKPELQSISKEVISSLKCELQSITKEVISMKDMIRNLEKTMKKSLTPSIPPSDLLPNANSATWELPQLPTTSVTIPPHPLRNQHLELGGGISKAINFISSSVGTTDNSSAAVSVASTEAFNKYTTFSCKPEVEAPAVFDSFKDNNSTTALINCTSNVIGTISSSTSASRVTSTNTSINTISSSKNITTASPFASNNLNKSPTAAFSIATAITTSVVPVMVSKENATSNLNKSAASFTFPKSNVNSAMLTTDLSQTSLTSTISKKESNTNGLFLSDLAQKFSFSFPVAKTSKSEIITPKVDFAFNAGSSPTKGVFTFTTSSTTSSSLSGIPNTTMLPNPAAVESSDKLGFLNGLPQQNTEALILSKMNTGQESVKEAFSLNRKVFNFILKPKCSGKSCKSPSKFVSVADKAEDEDTKGAQLDEWQNSVHFTQSIQLPGKNKEIADKFMKTVNKTLDGNTSPKVEIAGTSTSVRTSASLGPTASNMTEETDKLANSLKLRLNCFEQPKSDCIASRGCDPEKITYIDARNNEANPLEENPKNCSFTKAGNMFGDLKGMRNMGDAANLTSTSTDKTQSTQIFVFGDTTKSASGSAINYSKDDSAKSSTFSPLLPVTCFPCNKTTTTGEYATSKVADRKDISFGQKPLIFGNSSSALDETTADEAQPTSIFESKINGLPKGSLFGQKPPKFGNSSSMFGDPSHSIFDSAINNSKSGTVNASIYSSSFLSFTRRPSNENTTADGCIFGSGETPATTTTHVATSLFERLTVTTTSGSANTGPFVDLSKTATAVIGFASLPAKASKDDKVTIAFAKGKEKPGPGNFIGLTDQNAFARFAKPLTGVNDAKSNQTDSCSSAENNFNDNNYDPHYEPVIALPAEIVITTGEEEETKLFGERATLFRWDNTSKEWKERGVGELKILFHPIKQTYRMLMRREKIYKLILNHLVNTEFSFNEMKKNPKSFLWGAMNYAECPEGVLEELAVRFKNVILAELFREQLNKCIAANQNRAN